MFEQLMLSNEPGAGYNKKDTGKWQGYNYLKELYENRPWAEQLSAVNQAKMDRLNPQPQVVSSPDNNAWVLMSAQNPDIQRDLAQAVAPQATQMQPKSMTRSVSISASAPQTAPQDDYLMKLQDAAQKNAAFTQQYMSGQNDIAKAYAGQDAQVDFSPLMAYVDSWNNKDTLQRGYTKPKTQEERMAVVEQLKNGILKAQQGLSEDEMNMFKTLYGAKTDKERFDAQQKLAWANHGLGKEKLDLLKKTAGVNGKPPTSPQFLAATFGRRADDANRNLAELVENGYDPASGNAAAGRFFPNAVVGENAKLADQAERNFVNAVLRRESGAAIAASEFKNAEKQYFPRYGDTAEVLAQKEANRQRVIEGLRLESGKAWNMYNNFSDQAPTAEPEQMTREEKIKFLMGE